MLQVNPKNAKLKVGRGVFVYETDGIVTCLLDAKSKHAKVVKAHLSSIWVNNIKNGAEKAIKAQDEWLTKNSHRRGQIWYVDGIPCYARALNSERFTRDAWPKIEKKIKYAKKPERVEKILEVLMDHSQSLEFKDSTPWKVVQGYTDKLGSALEVAQNKLISINS